MGSVKCYDDYTLSNGDDREHCLGWHSPPCSVEERFFSDTYFAWKHISGTQLPNFCLCLSVLIILLPGYQTNSSGLDFPRGSFYVYNRLCIETFSSIFVFFCVVISGNIFHVLSGYFSLCPCAFRAKHWTTAPTVCRLFCQGQYGKSDIRMS